MYILNEAQLKRLDKYKESVQGTCTVEKYIEPFWEWLIKYFPVWIPVNAITLTGLFVNAFGTLMMLYYTSHGKEAAPSWVYIVNAIAMFVAQTLDIFDGMQDRRTGNVSPMGDYVDHACDSLSGVFIGITMSCTFLLGNSPYLAFNMCLQISRRFNTTVFMVHYKVTGSIKKNTTGEKHD
uniref:cholinephosphotransferase 1-like n=1 Tax=Styela clava TaxID=7725 RepID=UPI00193A5AFD|nr:cholinephosphotransferase 1-like [Styela clava]